MPKTQYFEIDLPHTNLKGDLAIDTETTGLSLVRDRLCLIQIKDEKGDSYLVKLAPPYNCPNLKEVLKDAKRAHIFHFARFDLAMIKHHLKIEVPNTFCTKIASRLCRTSTDKHSLKAVVSELFGVELNKDEQTSDWAGDLSKKQLAYAAADVEYLHEIRKILTDRLKREGRLKLAESCFAFLPARVELDLQGWDETDIFAH